MPYMAHIPLMQGLSISYVEALMFQRQAYTAAAQAKLGPFLTAAGSTLERFQRDVIQAPGAILMKKSDLEAMTAFTVMTATPADLYAWSDSLGCDWLAQIHLNASFHSTAHYARAFNERHRSADFHIAEPEYFPWIDFSLQLSPSILVGIDAGLH